MDSPAASYFDATKEAVGEVALMALNVSPNPKQENYTKKINDKCSRCLC